MSFHQEIEKCFGIEDLIFAGHSIEKKHARFMLSEASKQGFDLTDIEETSRNFLEGKNCSIEHIEKQIERIRELENYL